MGKGTNQIATEAEASVVGGRTPIDYSANRCITKERAGIFGCSVRDAYDNNQLVKYSDLSAKYIFPFDEGDPFIMHNMPGLIGAIGGEYNFQFSSSSPDEELGMGIYTSNGLGSNSCTITDGGSQTLLDILSSTQWGQVPNFDEFEKVYDIFCIPFSASQWTLTGFDAGQGYCSVIDYMYDYASSQETRENLFNIRKLCLNLDLSDYVVLGTTALFRLQGNSSLYALSVFIDSNMALYAEQSEENPPQISAIGTSGYPKSVQHFSADDGTNEVLWAWDRNTTAGVGKDTRIILPITMPGTYGYAYGLWFNGLPWYVQMGSGDYFTLPVSCIPYLQYQNGDASADLQWLTREGGDIPGLAEDGSTSLELGGIVANQGEYWTFDYQSFGNNYPGLFTYRSEILQNDLMVGNGSYVTQVYADSGYIKIRLMEGLSRSHGSDTYRFYLIHYNTDDTIRHMVMANHLDGVHKEQAENHLNYALYQPNFDGVNLCFSETILDPKDIYTSTNNYDFATIYEMYDRDYWNVTEGYWSLYAVMYANTNKVEWPETFDPQYIRACYRLDFDTQLTRCRPHWFYTHNYYTPLYE